MGIDQSTTGGSRTIGHLVFTEGPDTLSFRFTRWARWYLMAVDAVLILLGLAAAALDWFVVAALVTPQRPGGPSRMFGAETLGQEVFFTGIVGLVSAPWVALGIHSLWQCARPSHYPGRAEHVFDRRADCFRRGSRIACELVDVRRIWLHADRELEYFRILVGLTHGTTHLSSTDLGMRRPEAGACARLVADFLGVPVVESEGMPSKPEPRAVKTDPVLP